MLVKKKSPVCCSRANPKAVSEYLSARLVNYLKNKASDVVLKTDIIGGEIIIRGFVIGKNRFYFLNNLFLKSKIKRWLKEEYENPISVKSVKQSMCYLKKKTVTDVFPSSKQYLYEYELSSNNYFEEEKIRNIIKGLEYPVECFLKLDKNVFNVYVRQKDFKKIDQDLYGFSFRKVVGDFENYINDESMVIDLNRNIEIIFEKLSEKIYKELPDFILNESAKIKIIFETIKDTHNFKIKIVTKNGNLEAETHDITGEFTIDDALKDTGLSEKSLIDIWNEKYGNE